MAKKGIIRRVAGRFVNVSAWSNKKEVISHAKEIKRMVKSLFTIGTPYNPEETFDIAMKRLNISDKDLEIRVRHYKRNYLIFLLFALCMFSYGLYSIWNMRFLAFIVSTGLTCMCLGLSFKYHFWVFQIKNRRLGCSVTEWYYKGLLGQESTTKK